MSHQTESPLLSEISKAEYAIMKAAWFVWESDKVEFTSVPVCRAQTYSSTKNLNMSVCNAPCFMSWDYQQLRQILVSHVQERLNYLHLIENDIMKSLVRRQRGCSQKKKKSTEKSSLLIKTWLLFSRFCDHLVFEFFIFWETEREKEGERERASRASGEGQRGRETQNLKQAPGSELSAQIPTRGSNPWTMRSWTELMLDT